uniref:ARID domain-containing protein n=1 Tax=Meloidogyne incognita TaxID=6306 RepID=A0A914LTK6_MELIC
MISPMALESLLEGVQNQDLNITTKKEGQQQNQNNNFNEKIKENEQIINRKRKLSLNSSTNFDDFNENKNNLVSSPNISFQQTILDLAQSEALKNKNNEEKDFNGKLEIGEEDEEGNHGDNDNNSSNDFNKQRSQLLEFFEARKAFERMLSQFVGHQRMFSSSSSPSSLPFQQQLADQLSPFLLALNNTNQQQLETINNNNNNNIQSTSSTSTELLFSDSSFQNNPFFFPHWQQQKNFFQFSSEKLNKEEIINNSEIFTIDGPEDLTTTKDEESSTTTISELINNGQQQQQQNWSYEDQFKQLYDLSEDTSRKEWLNDWLQFMHKIGKPVTRIPIMAKQVLDLYELYRLVVQHGGLVEVINKKLWREITKGLNLPPSITSAAFTLRTQYSKYLFDYECHRHNFSNIADLQAAVDGNKREGRKNPLPGTSTTTNSSSTPPSIQKQEQNVEIVREGLHSNSCASYKNDRQSIWVWTRIYLKFTFI